VKVHVLELPQASVAEQTTVVVPNPKVDPLVTGPVVAPEATQVMTGVLQLSIAATVKGTEGGHLSPTPS